MNYKKLLCFCVVFLLVSLSPASAIQFNAYSVLNDDFPVKEPHPIIIPQFDDSPDSPMFKLVRDSLVDGKIVTSGCESHNVSFNNFLLRNNGNDKGITISLSGSCIDAGTGQPLKLSQFIPVHEKVNWVSIVYRNPNDRYTNTSGQIGFDPNMDIEILVNGNVILHKTVYNKYAWDVPTGWTSKYPEMQWIAFQYVQLLNFYGDSQGVWDLMNKEEGINNDTRNFVREYYSYFKDNVDLTIQYPDNSVKRCDMVSYLNGIDVMPDPNNPKWTDFELVQSFAITKDKTTKSDLEYWLNRKTDYFNSNYLKACYGTFLSACMVICCHDQNADTVAPDLNVTWNRDKPTLVMNGLTQNQTYIHTPDASMGMNIQANSTTIYEPPFLERVYDNTAENMKLFIQFIGAIHGWDTSKFVKFVDKIQKSIKWIVLKFLFVKEGEYHVESGEWKEKAFRFACSSSLSPIEDKILQFERFPVNSVLLGLGQKVNNGTVLNIEDQGSNVLIHTVNDTNTRILIDSDTMLAKEIIGEYKGSTSTVPAYCFYDYQTGRATQLGNQIIHNNCEWLGPIGGLLTTIGSTIAYMVIKGTIPPNDKNKYLGVAIGLVGIWALYLDFGLAEGWNYNKLAKFLVSVAFSLVPIYGAEGGTVGELIISYVGKDGIKRDVTHISGKFEGYVLTTMKVRPGDAFKAGNGIEPIYVVTAQYVKFGVPESVLKTAVGKTPQEAIRAFIKSNSIQEGLNIVIDTYNPDTDKYTTKKYKNIQEYLK